MRSVLDILSSSTFTLIPRVSKRELVGSVRVFSARHETSHSTLSTVGRSLARPTDGLSSPIQTDMCIGGTSRQTDGGGGGGAAAEAAAAPKPAAVLTRSSQTHTHRPAVRPAGSKQAGWQAGRQAGRQHDGGASRQRRSNCQTAMDAAVGAAVAVLREEQLSDQAVRWLWLSVMRETSPKRIPE